MTGNADARLMQLQTYSFLLHAQVVASWAADVVNKSADPDTTIDSVDPAIAVAANSQPAAVADKSTALASYTEATHDPATEHPPVLLATV